MTARGSQRGQMLPLFALSFSVVLLFTGLAVDASYALSQRRSSQNAADFAALAGARIVAQKMSGSATGTDANVKSAIERAIAENNATTTNFWILNSASYVDGSGSAVGLVGLGVIPASAAGVTVNARVTWKPFFLGLIGANSWTAGASATARARTVSNAPGIVFPAAMWRDTMDDLAICPTATPAQQCDPDDITGGNTPSGGHGWLAFGCTGDGGQNGDCGQGTGYLQDELDPPGNSHGCCTAVPAGGYIRVKSLTGNRASGDGSYWVDNKIIVLIPVYDTKWGSGSNGEYRIIGFAPVELTQVFGASNIDGVRRGPMVTDPTFGGSALTVQLVR